MMLQTSTSVYNISTNSSQENYSDNSDSSRVSNSDYIYTILTAVTSGLSMIGGICICLLYYAFKDVRTPGRKLLLFLAISDAILAFGNLLGVIWYLYSETKVINRSPVYCKFQSALTIYFSNTAFTWTVIMGTCLFVSTILNNPTFTATYMKLFHILSWIPPGKTSHCLFLPNVMILLYIPSYSNEYCSDISTFVYGFHFVRNFEFQSLSI